MTRTETPVTTFAGHAHPEGGHASAQGEARALREAAGVCRLDDAAILQVHGDDVREWLNGQITNDVAHGRSGDAVYALIINLKGKVMTDMWALDRGDDFLLVLPADRAEPMRDYLDGYVVMEDVEFDIRDDVAVITVQGPRAPEVVEAVDDARDTAWPCARLGEGGRDVVVSQDGADAVYDALVEAARVRGGSAVGETGWELARIREARPRLDVDFGDWTLPQEAALKERAVSFQKGCYQGQEAVVMLEHRGRPPKRLTRLEVEGEEPPAWNTPLSNDDGTPIGFVTSACVDPDTPGRLPALGYLKRKHAACDMTVHVDGHTARVLELLGG